MNPFINKGNEVDEVDRMEHRDSESLAEEVSGDSYRLRGATGRYAATSEHNRFWSKVCTAGPPPPFRPDLGPCWLWLGRLNADGYPVFAVALGPGDWTWKMAHRYAYELLGMIPPGLTLDHLCEVKECVRPGHLEPVTNAENLRRRHARHRLRGATT
jgi:hypothetical protein